MLTHRYVDLKGKTFGRLVVVKYFGKDKHRRAMWKCACTCGKSTVVAGVNLQKEYTKSCGCLFMELNKGITVENGEMTKLYGVWSKMKDRCLNHASKDYRHYGGRGISIFYGWMKYENFHKWAHDNGYAEHLTIERIRNNGDYEPANCRWATRKEQSRNKDNNKIITFKGQAMTVIQWAEKLSIKRFTLYARFNNGWSVERALTTPTRKLTHKEASQ